MNWYNLEYVLRLRSLLCVLLVFFFFVFPYFSFCDEVAGVGADSSVVEDFSEDTPIDITKGAEDQKDSADKLVAADDFRLVGDSDAVSYTSHVLRLVLSLAFVVLLAYVAIRLMRKGRLFVQNDDAYLKLVANLTIEQGKSIKVFTLGNKAYVVGVAGSNITKIAEIEDATLVSAMNLKAEGQSVATSSTFSSVFSSFFPYKKDDKMDDRVSSFNDAFLKAQQNRINKINIEDKEEDRS